VKGGDDTASLKA
jgi:glutathione S-transferase